MRTVNHLINVTKTNSKVDIISGIDVDIRHGSISMYNVYKAFEETKNILGREIKSYRQFLLGQYDRIDSIRSAAINSNNSGHNIEAWLDNSIIPLL